MPLFVRRDHVSLLAVLLGLILGAPLAFGASSHLVSVRALHQAAESSARQRQAQLAQVQKFFSSKLARTAFEKAHLNPVEIQKAIPTLSQAELSRLSAETQKIQSNFAAGALNNQQITYILIALGVALLVTIIFVS